MNKEDIISSGLLELYVLGETTEAETTLVITMCNQYHEVKNELLNIEIAMEQYAQAHAIIYPTAVKNNIFVRLNITDNNPVAEQKLSPIVNLNKYKFLAAACAALLLASMFINVFFYNKAKNADNKIAAIASKMEIIEREEAEEKEELNIVRSKYSLPLKMTAAEIAPKDADAKIYWLTNTGEIFIDPSNLPTPPKGMQYQLWAIVNGKAVDAGLIISKDGKTLKLQQMKTFGKAEAFAVTLEVEGGVKASKEKPYVTTKL